MNFLLAETLLFVIFVIDQILVTVISAAEYHLISHNGKPSTDPFHSHTTKFKQQCISICGTNCKCHSFTVEIISPNELECHFYDTAAMREDLVLATGVQYNIELRECRDWYNVGARKTGVYQVNWMGRMKKNVRCNMELDGGGWTVFQRRYEPLSQDFDFNWNSYKHGFGDVFKEFWLGNDFIHEITSSKPHYFLMFGRKTNGERTFSKYGSFYIEKESQDYRIHFDETPLTGVQSLAMSNPKGNVNGMKFSTKEHDNDLDSGMNCALSYNLFWFNRCGNVFPNRKTFIRWFTFDREEGDIHEVEIMFKAM